MDLKTLERIERALRAGDLHEEEVLGIDGKVDPEHQAFKDRNVVKEYYRGVRGCFSYRARVARLIWLASVFGMELGVKDVGEDRGW